MPYDNILVLIRYYLNSGIADEIDLEKVKWDEILILSHAHGVDGIIWKAIEDLQSKGKLSLVLKDKVDWFGNVRRIISRNKEVDSVIGILRNIFEETGIRWAVLKGLSCAQYYRHSEYRPAGDIDIFVGSADYNRAKDALRQRIETIIWGHEDVKHVALSVEGVVVELHKHWELKTAYNDDMLMQVSGINGVFCLRREYNLVYVFAHLYRHFIEGGITLRHVMDWVIMMRAEGDVDNRRVMDMIKDEGLESAWNAFGWMVKRYFMIDVIGVNGKEILSKSEGIWQIILESPQYTSGGRGAGESNLRRLLNAYMRCFKAWRLFPVDCFRYWCRLVLNNVKGIRLK